MHRDGWYMRHVILPDGRRRDFGVYRFRCSSCGRTVSFLPDFCVPYKHFSADVIAAVLQAVLMLGLSLRAVAAVNSAYNAASFSRHCAGRWVRQFHANSHNLWHFGLPRLGIRAAAVSSGGGVLLGLLLASAAMPGGGSHAGLRVVQRELACVFPPYGIFRAQLLSGCVT